MFSSGWIRPPARGGTPSPRRRLPTSPEPRRGMSLSFARREPAMSDLLRSVLNAHGGLDRWSQVTELGADVRIGGALWGWKGYEGILADTHVTLDPHVQKLSLNPFGPPGRRSVFTPDRNAIETPDGKILAERRNPRSAFAGHGRETPWDELHAVYFSGYAMWNYLTTPFLFTRPGVEVTEIEPWHEHGEPWRRLAVRFPDYIATHAREQTFYYDQAGLLRRHDYDAEVLGKPPATHYTYDHRVFGGFTFPTRRRVLARQPDGTTVAEPVLITIDVLHLALH